MKRMESATKKGQNIYALLHVNGGRIIDFV